MNNESGGQKEMQMSMSMGERMVIPMEYHLGEQQFLMRLMVPEGIKPHVVPSDGQKVGIEDALFMRWHEKYSNLFRLYCNTLDSSIALDRERIERIVTNTMNDADYAEIRKYLEDPVRANKEEGTGGRFFVDDKDEEEFLDLYKQ